MNLPKTKKSKRPGADRRWTLLFIGDHGNVVTLKRFKAIVLASGFLFVVAIGAVGALFYMNKGITKKNQEYRNRIENFQKNIETLRHEKEILMARLVLAESKAKENTSERQPSQTDTNTDEQGTPGSQTAPKIGAAEVKQKMASVPAATPPQPASLESRDIEVGKGDCLAIVVIGSAGVPGDGPVNIGSGDLLSIYVGHEAIVILHL